LTRRQRRIGQARAALIGAAAFVSITPLYARPALAAGPWAITATGSAVAESAVVPRGRPPTATILLGSVRLEWAPSTYPTGKEVGGYIVRRQLLGKSDAIQICTVVAPFRTCQDSPTPGQQVVYTVGPTEQLWRGPASTPSNPVTLPAAPLAAPIAAASPSPGPTPGLAPGPSLSPNPSPTPTPRPGLPKPSPSPSPTP
jgi:hypothetical protein